MKKNLMELKHDTELTSELEKFVQMCELNANIEAIETKTVACGTFLTLICC